MGVETSTSTFGANTTSPTEQSDNISADMSVSSTVTVANQNVTADATAVDFISDSLSEHIYHENTTGATGQFNASIESATKASGIENMASSKITISVVSTVDTSTPDIRNNKNFSTKTATTNTISSVLDATNDTSTMTSNLATDSETSANISESISTSTSSKVQANIHGSATQFSTPKGLLELLSTTSSTISKTLTSPGSNAPTSSDAQFDNTSGNQINQKTMDFTSGLPTSHENTTFYPTAKPDNTLHTRSQEYQMTSSVTMETTTVAPVFTSERTSIPASTLPSLNYTSQEFSPFDRVMSVSTSMGDVDAGETSETRNSENSMTTTANNISDFNTERYSSLSTQTSDPVAIKVTTPELATPKPVGTTVTRTESATQSASELTTQTTVRKLVEPSKLTTDEMEKISFELTTNILMKETTQEIDKPELQETSEIAEAITSQAGKNSPQIISFLKEAKNLERKRIMMNRSRIQLFNYI